MKKNTPYLFGILSFCSSCHTLFQPAYYLSPLDINSNYYQAIPLKSDSIKRATYGSMAFTVGSANDQGRDHLYSFHSNFHQSHNLGNFQVYYGAGFALGSYHVAEYRRIYYQGGAGLYNPYIADTTYHIPSSNNFFGAYGINGGFNFVHSFRNRPGEWRIGVETSLQNEFGKYLSFRKSFPDSAIEILATYSWTKTMGGYVEWLWKRAYSPTLFGFKVSGGTSLISSATYRGNQNSNSPFYFSSTFHVTKEKITWFSQFNTGTYTNTFQTGINYVLGKKKKTINKL
jgi:hypothetical protein